MAKLHIPPLGAVLTLASDWTFELYLEHRNSAMIETMKVEYDKIRRGGDGQMYVDWYGGQHKPVTLPAGTKLTIRRYYIRVGQKAFDSVTFSTKVGKKSCRLWVKLADANNIELEEIDG